MKWFAALVVALVPTTAAISADCKQEKAIYADRDGAYELKFEAVDSEAASSSYRFTIAVKNTAVMLDGFVESPLQLVQQPQVAQHVRFEPPIAHLARRGKRRFAVRP